MNLLVNADFPQKCVNEWWNTKMGLFEFQFVCKSLILWVEWNSKLYWGSVAQDISLLSKWAAGR